MVMEGCQGRRNLITLKEVRCPKCSAAVELSSDEAFAVCEHCGTAVYNDLMDCVFRCPQAKNCVGEAQYQAMLAARERWEADMAALADDDTW